MGSPPNGPGQALKLPIPPKKRLIMMDYFVNDDMEELEHKYTTGEISEEEFYQQINQLD